MGGGVKIYYLLLYSAITELHNPYHIRTYIIIHIIICIQIYIQKYENTIQPLLF